MSAEIATLGFKVDSSGLTTANKRLVELEVRGRKVEKTNHDLSSSFGVLKGAIGAAAAALAAFGAGSKLIDVTRQFDVLNAQLITATGSAENAARAFSAIQDFAASTPYDLAQTTEAFTKLVGLGITPSERAMRSYGDTASAKGKSIIQLVEAVADATTGEFERLKEFDIKTSRSGENVAFTFQGMTTTVKNNAQEIESYLIALGENNFAGSMANRMQTLDGAIANLGDEWDKLFLNVSQQGIGGIIEDGVRAAINGISELNAQLSSGQTAGYISALSSKFDGFGRDVAFTLDAISQLWAQVPPLWGRIGAEAANNVIGALVNMPENVRAIVQLMTVELAYLADSGASVGTKLVANVTLSFAKMVEVAKVYSRKLDSVLKPWEFSSVDLDSELARVNSSHEKAAAKILGGYEAAYSGIDEARQSTIQGIMDEHTAAIDSFEGQIKAADGLREAYNKMQADRANSTEDRLAEFGIGGKSAGGSSGGAESSAKTSKLISQMVELNTLTSELGKTESELFVMRQMAQAQADGANAEQLQRVYELSTAYTMQKSALNEVAQAQQEAKAAADQQKSAYDSWVSSIESAHKSASVLQQEIAKIDDAMKAGDVSEYSGTKAIKQLEGQIKSLSAIAANPFDQMVAGSKEALNAMSGMFESGSRDAQKLAVAMQALNLVQAVGAVLNQGNGDPYTAFGRMAAMATMVGSLGMSINSLSGGFGDESGAAQSSQGTTIWGEKSESIANSIDMTANATQKLVGINTSMLGALRTMQSGILAAAGLISRDAVIPTGDVSGKLLTSNPFGGALGKLTDFTSKIVDPLGLFGKAFDKLLGGKSKVINEGIQIVGDSLAGVIDSVMVQGFQDIKYKKWRFGGTKNKTVFSDITDVVGEQVSLVFSSMRDSVMAGATALGLSQTEIETALNNFQIATTQISLKGLDAAAQQKEIEAVFSQIFDGMAESVIPFIGQFQRVGEGMGETLARVATQVAVTEEAVRRFGFAFADKMLNPEAFAQAADNLSMLVGGVDELASKTASFVQFASAETQLAIAQDDLTRAFAEVGLTVPESSAALWELMSTLDGTTESGLSQIATLLNLQDAAANYYSLLEREQEKQKAAADKAAADKAAEEKRNQDKLLSDYRAMQNEINQIEAKRSQMFKSLSDSLQSIVDQTYQMSKATAQLSLDSALAAARVGDFSMAMGQDFSAAMPNQSDFSDFASFAYEQALTANKIQELANLSGNQVSAEDRQAESLDKMQQDINTLTRNMSRLQEQSNEALDIIARGVTTVRIEQ